MNPLSLTVVASLSLLAPTPKEPPPDPLARGYLGIQVQQGSLTIDSIQPGTPAERAGLQAGDTITRVGDLQPRAFEQVLHHICSYRPGTVLTVEVRRNGGTKTMKVTLAARPDDLGLPSLPRDHLPVPTPEP